METFESNCLMVFGWAKKTKKGLSKSSSKISEGSIRSLKEKD